MLQGVHDTSLFCLDGQDLAGSADKASDMGPPCLLLVWGVKYMLVVIYIIL